MAEYPALPLFTDAYLADTTHLSDAEHGVYLLLLMHAWRSPGTRLPNDKNWLARKLRKTVEQVDAEVMPLVAEFFQNDGNWLIQKRLKKENEYLTKTRERQSGRAKSRWNKEKSSCENDADPHSSGNAPTPTPTPTPQKENKQRNSDEKNFAEFYLAYPLKRARGAAVRAYAKALKKSDAETLLAAARRYAAEMAGKDPKFIAHPATWLNAERWLDGVASQGGNLFGGMSDRDAQMRAEFGEGYVPPAFGDG
jgi:uncharacterized protein YdaU (DUF1376 family)